MNSHWPARAPAAMAGALKFPAFLLLWSLGLLLAAGAVLPADAIVRKGPVAFAALSALPTLEDQEAFGAALETELRESAVVSGVWQPPVELPPAVPASPPVLAPQLTVRAPQVKELPAADAAQAQPALTESEGGSTVPAPVVAGAASAATSLDVAEPPAPLAVARTAAEPLRFEVRPQPTSATRVARAATLKPTAARVLESAQRALTEGRFAAAYRMLMGDVEQAAAHPTYLGVLAVSALALGRDAEALLIYERLTQLAPDDGRWWAGAALSRERLGLEAAAQFEAVLELAGDDDTLHTLAATRLQDLG